MIPLPTRAAPRFVVLAVAGYVVVLRHLRALGFLSLALLALGVAALANAGAANLPERKASLCEFLGYAPSCKLKWEAMRYGFAEMALAVDEHLGDPDYIGPSPKTQAAVLRLAVHVVNGEEQPTPAIVSQVYQRVESSGWSWWWLLDSPPCVTPDQAALADEDYEDAYGCLTEAQVAEAGAVAGMMPFARADWPLLARVRELHGANGVPVPFVVYGTPEITDEQGSLLPSEVRVQFMYQFAVPAPGWTPPSSGE